VPDKGSKCLQNTQSHTAFFAKTQHFSNNVQKYKKLSICDTTLIINKLSQSQSLQNTMF